MSKDNAVLILNLSKDNISTNPDKEASISKKVFWKQFLRLTRLDLSSKELDVLSDYLIDSPPLKIPNTVVKSLDKKGYLINKVLSQQLINLKEKIPKRVKLIFNFELYDS